MKSSGVFLGISKIKTCMVWKGLMSPNLSLLADLEVLYKQEVKTKTKL